MKRGFYLILLFIVLATSMVAAEDMNILVNDSFTDRSVDATSPKEADWRIIQNGRKLEVIPEPIPGKLTSRYWLRLAPEKKYGTFVGVFDQGAGAQLGDKVGSKLQLSLVFRFEQAAITGTELRVGLSENGGTPSIENDWRPYTDDPGYYLVLGQSGGWRRSTAIWARKAL